MAGLLGKLARFLNKDLSGRTWVRGQPHPYFKKLIYFGHKDSSKCYWEAELSLIDLPEMISVTLDGTAEGPEASEEAFCRRTLADLDGLFAKCCEAFKEKYDEVTESPFPSHWKGTFILDGISVPTHGDTQGAWEVCYFVPSTNRYFTAVIESDLVKYVRIDG